MRFVWLFITVVILSCGAPPKTPPPAPLFSTVSGAPTAGTALPSEQLTTASAVRRFGISSQGTLVVSLDDATYEYSGGALLERALYAETGEPTSLGAVSNIGPRATTGAWLAAQNGLYELDGFYLSRSPLDLGNVRAAFEQSTGAMKGLWLATDQGLVFRTDTVTNRFTIDGDSDVTQLVVDPSGSNAFAVFSNKLYRVVLTGDGIFAELAPMVVGDIHGIAASSGNLYAATPVGLVRWNATLTPPWQIITLAADGMQLSVDAVATDPVDGVVWALGGGKVIQVDDANKATQFDQASGNALAVDQLGDVWMMNGAQLTRLESGGGGMAVSFATAVQPWIQTNCSMCHATFTQIEAFTPEAEQALLRVRQGDMPRCPGGVPCPAGTHLTADQYSVLEQWIRGGKQP